MSILIFLFAFIIEKTFWYKIIKKDGFFRPFDIYILYFFFLFATASTAIMLISPIVIAGKSCSSRKPVLGVSFKTFKILPCSTLVIT